MHKKILGPPVTISRRRARMRHRISWLRLLSNRRRQATIFSFSRRPRSKDRRGRWRGGWFRWWVHSVHHCFRRCMKRIWLSGNSWGKGYFRHWNLGITWGPNHRSHLLGLGIRLALSVWQLWNCVWQLFNCSWPCWVSCAKRAPRLTTVRCSLDWHCAVVKTNSWGSMVQLKNAIVSRFCMSLSQDIMAIINTLASVRLVALLERGWKPGCSSCVVRHPLVHDLPQEGGKKVINHAYESYAHYNIDFDLKAIGWGI